MLKEENERSFVLTNVSTFSIEYVLLQTDLA